jgi:hypothetical protein
MATPGVQVGNGTAMSVVVEMPDPENVFGSVVAYPGINDAGVVAFASFLIAGGEAVKDVCPGRVRQPGQIRTIAQSSNSDYGHFFGQVAINNANTVVFSAKLKGGRSGSFMGRNPVTDTIVMTGDPLDGSTVQQASLALRGCRSFRRTPWPRGWIGLDHGRF